MRARSTVGIPAAQLCSVRPPLLRPWRRMATQPAALTPPCSKSQSPHLQLLNGIRRGSVRQGPWATPSGARQTATPDERQS